MTAAWSSSAPSSAFAGVTAHEGHAGGPGAREAAAAGSRTRWVAIPLVIFWSLSQQLVLMLQELESSRGVMKSTGEQCGIRWYHLHLMNLSRPGFSTELPSHVQLLIFLSAWRVNRHLKLSMTKTDPLQPLAVFSIIGNHQPCSHSSLKLESCP